MLAETTPDIRTAAKQLWENSVEAEPVTTAVYLFPSGEEIRLVFLDPTTGSSRNSHVTPFYFGANEASGLPYRSAMAVIRPEEKDTLQPPEGWGTWQQAELVWRA